MISKPNKSTSSFLKPVVLSRYLSMNLHDFQNVLRGDSLVTLDEAMSEYLDETREFVSYLLQNNIPVYGLTTGYGDLRDHIVSPQNAARLSENIIQSHDAGIGPSYPPEVVLGAMLIRANSLAKGYSGIQTKTLKTLVQMINARIIPFIPCTGSLGASGDLASLARLARAMKGDPVPVLYKGEWIDAKKALIAEGIVPFQPDFKEGLALTNGTSFMASMLAGAYLKEVHLLENIFALEGLFLCSVQAVDAAFYGSIQEARGQSGQCFVAKVLSKFFHNSPMVNRSGTQNDYSTRCLPQIFGPKIEVIQSCLPMILRELDAVTDNPLIFKDGEITDDVCPNRIFLFNSSKWTVVSGGNFHGECLATAADIISLANAKIALTIERQITFLMNPARNKRILPPFLVANKEDVGLLSGFMIPQYTANALTQKICFLAHPVSNFNITSSNESEDVVSYGASSGEKLLEQLELLEQLITIFLLVVMQSYAISKAKFQGLSSSLLSEKVFAAIQKAFPIPFPIMEDGAFDGMYIQSAEFLKSTELREILHFPLENGLEIYNKFTDQPNNEISEAHGCINK